MTKRTIERGLASMAVIFMTSASATAASHLWRFTEIFSNGDGTIQFIEMQESLGACMETQLTDKWVRSAVTGSEFIFSKDIEPPTCNEYLLLATAGFAALPGAPTPDYIMEDNFFSIDGDTLTYWLYAPATWTHGAVPTDGVNSLADDGTVTTNSPTNYAGETGSVVVPCNPADFDASGDVGFGDLLAVISGWGPCKDCALDLDGSGDIGFGDLLAVLSAWGPCP